jgi:hypothetical protein
MDSLNAWMRSAQKRMKANKEWMDGVEKAPLRQAYAPQSMLVTAYLGVTLNTIEENWMWIKGELERVVLRFRGHN